MAIDLLWGPATPHEPRFDLESFFYVLVYICAVYVGPMGQTRSENTKPEFLIEWLYPSTFQTLGYVKSAQRDMSIHNWRKKVSIEFAPYWNPLKICVRKYKRLIRQGDPKHEDVLYILREALEHLPLDDNSTIGDDSTTTYNYGPGGYFTGSNYPPPETIEVAEETDWEDEDGYDTPTPGSKRKRVPPAYVLVDGGSGKRKKDDSRIASVG